MNLATKSRCCRKLGLALALASLVTWIVTLFVNAKASWPAFGIRCATGTLGVYWSGDASSPRFDNARTDDLWKDAVWPVPTLEAILRSSSSGGGWTPGTFLQVETSGRPFPLTTRSDWTAPHRAGERSPAWAWGLVWPKVELPSASAAYGTLGIPLWTIVSAGAALFVLGIAGPSRAQHGCPRCGYDVRGLTESRCPECGSQFDRSARRRR